MASYAGSALVIQWINPAGTTTLSGAFRSFSTSPTVDLYEASAGADTHKTYLPGIKDQTIQVTLVQQTGGSVLLTSLREGTQGTLIVGPEGTVATKVKETYPAIAMGPSLSQPYNNVPELSITFQQNGAPTYAGW
jgi:hypothetical protein